MSDTLIVSTRNAGARFLCTILLPLIIGSIHRGTPRTDAKHRAPSSFQQISIVGDKHKRASKGIETLLKHLKGCNIEVVCWLIKEQDINVLRHNAGQQCTRLLAPRKGGNFKGELVVGKEKAHGPRSNVNRFSLKVNGVSIGAEKALEGYLRGELFTGLIKKCDP